MTKAKATNDKNAVNKAKSDKDKDQPFFKTVADNRKARHEYDILETEEAGIQLVGTEVKAIRAGKANLADAFVRIEDQELWLYSCHISPYDHGNRFNHEPLRKRRLLMHHQQILKLKSKMQEQGLTLIPLKMYFKGNLVKIDLALCKGRKLWDKRDNIAKKEVKRGLDRLMKHSALRKAEIKRANGLSIPATSLVSDVVANLMGSNQMKDRGLKFSALYLVASLFTASVISALVQIVFMPAAFAASPIAVLKSGRNAAAYQDQHIGTLEDDFKAFRNTLNGANVRFDEIGDSDVDAGAAKLSGFKLIIVPLLVDLPQSEVSALGDYQKNGGKLLISDGAGAPGPGAQALAAMAGVASLKQNTLKEVQKLNWPRTVMPFSCDFAIASVVAQLVLNQGATSMATWQDNAGQDQAPAIAKQGNAIFLGWSPGMQGEISSNSQLIAQALDELSPGITQAAAVQISFADYTTISQELDYLAKRTDESIKTAKQAEFSVPLKTIQGFYDSAMDHVTKFQTAYSDRRFLDADEQVQKARADFCMAFAQSMPIRPVEARCIWLDRGTIVAAHNPQGMAQLFDKLKQAGINVVSFETNNAGFAMFPSKVGTQNPETVGWDPLGSALFEARKRNIEFHLWMWTFNVGNVKHNPIIGKEADYPGPVLSSHDFAWALAARNGSFVPPRQFEYWLDPSNPECRQYIKDFATEMVTRYKVDGLQLDYIRYPFNNRGSEMGYNWLGRQKFERETGMSLDRLDDDTRQLWIAWKVAQVSSFVKDISETLRSASPGLRISAAVYAMPRRMRTNAIQQEWETWVANGWVDTINPMTYVDSPKLLTEAASYVRESTADKALSYPGLSIRQLDTAGLN